MSPETALTELRDGLEIALWVGGPLLLVVLVVGVVVGVIQAATQLNEPTIACWWSTRRRCSSDCRI